MAKKKETLDLVPFEEYAVIVSGAEMVQELITENLGGEAIQLNDLTRVKVPAGGSTIWSIPTIDGKENTEYIDGVLIYHVLKRAYWAKDYDGSTDPPDCYSDDCVKGLGSIETLTKMGNPDGNCLNCPMAEFGSGKNGHSQACNMTRKMFFLRPDSLLPIMINIPAGSLKNAKDYLVGLTGKNRLSFSVITRLSLAEDKNADGILFSKVEFTKLADVTDIAQMRAYVNSVRPLLKEVAAKENASGDDGLATAADYDPGEAPIDPESMPAEGLTDEPDQELFAA